MVDFVSLFVRLTIAPSYHPLSSLLCELTCEIAFLVCSGSSVAVGSPGFGTLSAGDGGSRVTFAATELTPGTSYAFVLVVRNAANVSSAAATATVLKSALPLPSVVVMAPANGVKRAQAAQFQTQLTPSACVVGSSGESYSFAWQLLGGTPLSASAHAAIQWNQRDLAIPAGLLTVGASYTAQLSVRPPFCTLSSLRLSCRFASTPPCSTGLTLFALRDSLCAGHISAVWRRSGVNNVHCAAVSARRCNCESVLYSLLVLARV
jgi:hypothetical protein